jgi:hypothetical protein
LSTKDGVIKAYDKGLRHFAISNYYPSKPLYPLGNHFSDLPSDIISSPNAEHVQIVGENLHLSGLGSLWESGEPIGEDGIHIGVGDVWQFAVTNILANLQHSNGGGVVINHPKWSGISVKTIKKMLDYRPEVLGVEIYNGDIALGSRSATGWAIDQWDEVLNTGRRAWGFCVQDWDVNVVGRIGCNVLLVDAFTEEKCLEAYRNGNFYGRLQISSNLKFSNIAYDSNTKKLTVKTENADWIDIIYGIKGKVYRQRYDNTAECSYNVPSGATYIRVEAGKKGENTHTLVDTFYNDCSDVIFSNPIMLVDSIIDGKKKQNTIMWF